MKISEVLARVKEVKPNPFSDDTLLNWLNDIEAKVQTEALGRKPEGADHYDLPGDLDTELMLPKPYDECYVLYVQAQIDFALQEFDTYNNTMQMFNTAFREVKNYYVRTLDREQVKINVQL